MLSAVRVTVVGISAAVLAGGCATGAAPTPAPAPPPPPPPPAACLLDTAALAAATGLVWVPAGSTASDTRCVYDPAGSPRPAEGPAFLTVEIAPASAPGASLDAVAALCLDGSRTPAGSGGFVCRFDGGASNGAAEDPVFAAAPRGDRVVTIAASGVPTGTTAARLVVALDQAVAALGR